MLFNLSEELIKNEWRHYEIYIQNKVENETNKNKKIKINKSIVTKEKLIENHYS